MNVRNSRVQAAIHACKQMELDMNFSKAQGAVTNAECDLEIAKEAYTQVCSFKKKKVKADREKPHWPIPNHWLSPKWITKKLHRP